MEGDSAGLDDLGTAADTAVSLGARFVSNSYGVPNETSTEATYDHYYDHAGVVVTASTGDTGNVAIRAMLLCMYWLRRIATGSRRPRSGSGGSSS